MTKIKLCIAVVDDDLPVRTALGRLLRAASYDVALFATGNEFLQSLIGRQPDCVILDFKMPGLSGIDVVSHLKADRIEIPAIIMTASDQEDLEWKVLAAGARDLLRKPFRDGQLLAVIESVLRSSDHRLDR